MANKGFTIDDLLAVRGASLNIPPMKTQDQVESFCWEANTTFIGQNLT